MSKPTRELPALPDRERWPETRRALVLWTQEHLDRELAVTPRRAWFDHALRAVLVSEPCDHAGEMIIDCATGDESRTYCAAEDE